jgi:hypothetical protein
VISKILNQALGSLSIPFYLENPRGKIAGERHNTLLGRQEWFIEFEGNKPLAGESNFRSSFNWNNELTFSSQISLVANGLLHGHGDPGPGGGCGVRPAVHLTGQATLNGILNISKNKESIEFSLNTTNAIPVQVNYVVDRVNFCGFTTQGPFSGRFDFDVPHELASTQITLKPMHGKISQDHSVDTEIIGVSKNQWGYWIEFGTSIN